MPATGTAYEQFVDATGTLIEAGSGLYASGLSLLGASFTGQAIQVPVNSSEPLSPGLQVTAQGGGFAAMAPGIAFDSMDTSTTLYGLRFLGGVSAPSAVTATPQSSGGTFIAGTYYWKVTATLGAGETTGSPEVSAAIVAGGLCQLAWTEVNGATGYNVYRATITGGESMTPALVARISSGATLTYADLGASTTAGAVPATNTTLKQFVDSTGTLFYADGGSYQSGLDLLGASFALQAVHLPVSSVTPLSPGLRVTARGGGLAALTPGIKFDSLDPSTAHYGIQFVAGGVELSPPSGLAAGAPFSGGSLAAGTYYWQVTAVNALGQTTGSNEATATVATSGESCTLTWAGVSGATGYNLYRATASGWESAGPALVASIMGGSTTTYTDTGTATTAGSVPPYNTTNPLQFVDRSGVLITAAAGSYMTGLAFAGASFSDSAINLGDGNNIRIGSVVGAKIGLNPTEMIGFWGSSPIHQPINGLMTPAGNLQSPANAATGFHNGTLATPTIDATYTGGFGGEAYSIGAVVSALKLAGILGT